MIDVPSSDNHEEPAQRAEKMSQLTTLIQAYPAEAQLIMAAIEDGLTLGPAHILGAARREMEPPAGAVMAAAGTPALRRPASRDEPVGLPDPDPDRRGAAEHAGSGTDWRK